MHVTKEAPLSISIAAVERDTGLPKDTLRVWERRYGFPNPGRDQFGERLYPQEQVEKLRLLKRLLDQGHRPSKIIHQNSEALRKALNNIRGRDANSCSEEGNPLFTYIDLIKRHQIDAFRCSLSQLLLETELERFIIEWIAPLNTLVGEAWSCGDLEIFEEHLYTESLQVILRNAINTISVSGSQPRVLLTTFPQEQHGLGILMAEALFALNDCRCISLGAQTPVIEIINAARSQQVDIVALSFSSIMTSTQVTEGLNELRLQLPDSVEIWAGGANRALKRKTVRNIQVLSSLNDIGADLKNWRSRHAPRSSKS